MTPSGLVLLDKPAGITSFSALGALKSRLGTRRVGHTGTLDRFASGLLLAPVGSYTRLAVLFGSLDKSYRALLRFGAQTDTLDPEGEVVAVGPVPPLERVREALSGLVGEIEQTPPAYSAVHVEGRRAYQIAREGRAARLRPRRVSIRGIEVLRYDPPELELVVTCSKGTYIRALARDLALAAGSRGHLRALRRTTVGPFAVEEAVRPEAFDPARHLLAARDFLRRLQGVTRVTLDREAVEWVRHGRPLAALEAAAAAPDGVVALFDDAGALVAVVRRESGKLHYLAVTAEAAV